MRRVVDFVPHPPSTLLLPVVCFWWAVGGGALITGLDFPSPSSGRSIILGGASIPTDHHEDCSWRSNVSSQADVEKLPSEKLDLLEDCLFTYLAQREARSSSSDAYKSLLAPPWEFPLRVMVHNFIVRQVDIFPTTSTQFNIHADVLVAWNDTRLAWNESEWKLDSFELHENHEVWKPTFMDESGCGMSDGCVSRVTDLQIDSDGTVHGRLTFRYVG